MAADASVWSSDTLGSHGFDDDEDGRRGRRPYTWPLFDPLHSFRAIAAFLAPARFSVKLIWPLGLIAIYGAMFNWYDLLAHIDRVFLQISFWQGIVIALLSVNFFSKFFLGLVLAHYREDAREFGLKLKFGLLLKFYVDRSTIKNLDLERQRTCFATSLLVKLALAAIGFFLWNMMRKTGTGVADVVLAIGVYGFSSFLFVANPLFPADGCKWFSATLGRPNLRADSLKLNYLILTRRPIPPMLSRGEVVAMVLFGIASIVFTALLVFLIISLIAMVLEAQFQGSGVVMFCIIMALAVNFFISIRSPRKPVRKPAAEAAPAKSASRKGRAARRGGTDSIAGASMVAMIPKDETSEQAQGADAPAGMAEAASKGQGNMTSTPEPGSGSTADGTAKDDSDELRDIEAELEALLAEEDPRPPEEGGPTLDDLFGFGDDPDDEEPDGDEDDQDEERAAQAARAQRPGDLAGHASGAGTDTPGARPSGRAGAGGDTLKPIRLGAQHVPPVMPQLRATDPVVRGDRPRPDPRAEAPKDPSAKQASGQPHDDGAELSTLPFSRTRKTPEAEGPEPPLTGQAGSDAAQGRGGKVVPMPAPTPAAVPAPVPVPADTPPAPAKRRGLLGRRRAEVPAVDDAEDSGGNDLDRVLKINKHARKKRNKWVNRGIWAVLIAGFIWVCMLPYDMEVGGEFIVQPIDRAEVRARTDGQIIELRVQEGDWVQKDEIMAVLDNEDEKRDIEVRELELVQLHAQLRILEFGARPEEIAVARQSVETAQIQVEIKTNDVAKTQQLLDRGTIPEAEFTDAVDALRLAEAGLEEAQAGLDLVQAQASEDEIIAAKANIQKLEAELAFARLLLEQTNIRANAEGQIVSTMAEVPIGAYLTQAGEPFALLENNRTVVAEIEMPETSIDEVEIGANVELRLWSDTGNSVFGTVESISPKAEERDFGRIVRVQVRVPNPDGKLAAEMTGHGKVQAATRPVWEVFTRIIVRFFEVELWSWLP